MSDAMSIQQALCVIAAFYDEASPSDAEKEAVRRAKYAVQRVAYEITERIERNG
jgi:hypothetical protein